MLNLKSSLRLASKLAIAFVLATTAACSDTSSSTPAPPANPKNIDQKWADSLFQKQDPAKPITPNSVFGTWHVSAFETEKERIHISGIFKFTPDKMTLEIRCTDVELNNSIYAQVSVPAIIDESKIKVIFGDKKENEQQFGTKTLRCRATLAASEIDYTIENGKLTFTVNGKTVLVSESKLAD